MLGGYYRCPLEASVFTGGRLVLWEEDGTGTLALPSWRGWGEVLLGAVPQCVGSKSHTHLYLQTQIPRATLALRGQQNWEQGQTFIPRLGLKCDLALMILILWVPHLGTLPLSLKQVIPDHTLGHSGPECTASTNNDPITCKFCSVKDGDTPSAQ